MGRRRPRDESSEDGAITRARARAQAEASARASRERAAAESAARTAAEHDRFISAYVVSYMIFLNKTFLPSANFLTSWIGDARNDKPSPAAVFEN